MISTVKKLLSITFTCCIILSAASGTVADNIQPPTSLRGGVINTSADTFTKEDLELVDGRPRCCAHGCRHGGCVRRPTNCYWRHGHRVCPRSITILTNLQAVDEAPQMMKVKNMTMNLIPMMIPMTTKTQRTQRMKLFGSRDLKDEDENENSEGYYY